MLHSAIENNLFKISSPDKSHVAMQLAAWPNPCKYGVKFPNVVLAYLGKSMHEHNAGNHADVKLDSY